MSVLQFVYQIACWFILGFFFKLFTFINKMAVNIFFQVLMWTYEYNIILVSGAQRDLICVYIVT